jgi:signal transduction histidine kinase
VETAALRGSELTGQLKAYLGQTLYTLKQVDLNAVVEDAREYLLAVVPPDTRLEFELDPTAPKVLVDRSQLLQVVRILVVNAFESLEAGMACTVTLRTGVESLTEPWESPIAPDLAAAPGEYAFLEVRDSGSGMAQEILRKIFDPFFTTKFLGRGLGLPAVAGIIRNHKGTVQVQSEAGRGTTVKVLLPLVP